MKKHKNGKLHTQVPSAEEEKAPALSDKDVLKTDEGNTMPENGPRENVSEKENFEALQQEEAERKRQEERRKKRNWWIKTALLLVLIGASVYVLFPITNSLTDEGTRGFLDMVKGANLGYFFALLCVFLLYILTESFQYSYILKTSTGKFRPRNSIKVALLGKYYDAVTPLGTGGQPFQIYYLHKKDIPKGIATAVPLVKYTFATFAKGILSIVFFALVFVILPPEVSHKNGFTAIYVLAWVSMFVNMIIPAIMIFGSLFPRAGKKLMIRIVAFLAKIRIVKRKYTVTKKYVKEMGEYRRSLKEILKRWWIVIPLLGIALVTAVINFSLPFFTATALANTSPTWDLWAQMFCGGLLAYYSASLLPTPGNSGGIELTSGLVFASVLNNVAGGAAGAVSAWIILIWRFFTYYVYIIAGIGINIFEIIRSAVRNRRAAKIGKTM